MDVKFNCYCPIQTDGSLYFPANEGHLIVSDCDMHDKRFVSVHSAFDCFRANRFVYYIWGAEKQKKGQKLKNHNMRAETTMDIRKPVVYPSEF